MAANYSEADIPPWKKHLIARLRSQNKCNGNSVTVSTNRQLSLSPPLNECTGRTPKANNQSSVGIRPSSTCNQLSATNSASNTGKDGSVISANKFVSPLTLRKIKSSKMVQERAWTLDYTSCESVNMVSENDNYSRTSDSDSSEELHYGPGIVNKLKNKYLSLALRRETYTKQRPSILNLRKATSLENMLDEDVDESVKTDSDQRRMYQSNGTEKNSTNRYRNSKRGTQDIKRARSVEAISRFENLISPPPIENLRPKSLHEYILIGETKEGNDKYRKPKDSEAVEIENALFSNNYVPRLNRPKRITPVMNEREKPPADVVKQAKMIFEKRPEQRTKPPVNTGEVAAKVATYKNIIVQSKPVKKPPIKTKPVSTLVADKTPKNGTAKTVLNNKKKGNAPKVTPRIREITKKNDKSSKALPSNEVSKDVQVAKETHKEQKVEESLPKPVQLASPIPDVSLIEFPKSENDAIVRLCETPDLIMTVNPVAVSTPLSDETATQIDARIKVPSPTSKRKTEYYEDAKNSESVTSNHCDLNSERLINENVPFNEPLNLIINGNQSRCSPSPEDAIITQVSPIPVLSRRKIVSPPIRPDSSHFFDRVIEKNLINVAKSANAVKTDEKTDLLVPKKVRRPPREPETNSIVFKFTDRKDVPDYVQNDRSRTVGRIEMPKVSWEYFNVPVCTVYGTKCY
ncbi:hypothetical protein HHI36_012725 [Cryptolaemus montrouzieri]|uniref:Uncharacterized protein n=1 Tax=Cryptolaemus montrouzieri TaxID=559131 RepID=A0ABD2NGI3_9CUCU